MTLADQLDAAKGRPSGFDYMRILLSFLVMAMHAALTSYGNAADYAIWDTPLLPFLRAIVPCFFVLSGFLVAGSLARSRTLLMFAGLRVIRIYPALTVEVLLSAFLVGPIVTTLPWSEYFTDPHFFRYLVNVTGDISYLLPGVFADNPAAHTVNTQLWTVPYELFCYIALVALALMGLRTRRWLAPAAVVVLMAFHLIARMVRHNWDYEQTHGLLPAPLLIVFFMAGIGFYLYRDQVRFSAGWALAAALVAVVALARLDFGEYAAVPTLGYVTVYLGLCNPRRIRIIRAADYSYGVYLYGFVVQQVVMHALPGAREWWWNLLICVPLTTAFAALSWHCIEKPALRLKTPLAALEEMWLRTHHALLGRLDLVRGGGTHRPPAREVE